MSKNNSKIDVENAALRHIREGLNYDTIESLCEEILDFANEVKYVINSEELNHHIKLNNKLLYRQFIIDIFKLTCEYNTYLSNDVKKYIRNMTAEDWEYQITHA